MSDFEQCPFRALLRYGPDKVEEPSPPGDLETPLDRGSRVHKAAEHFITGQSSALIPELKSFEDDFWPLRERFARRDDTILVEQMLCFDKDWTFIGSPRWGSPDWDRIWMRVKQDAIVLPEPDKVVCIDFKTGKKAGNEVKHNMQLRVAATGAYFKYTDVDTFVLENWYTDKNIHVPVTYTRSEITNFHPEIDGRLRAVTSCVDFEPTPSVNACRYCYLRSGKIGNFGQIGTGDCSYAVTR
jgi:hypothetical protein